MRSNACRKTKNEPSCCVAETTCHSPRSARKWSDLKRPPENFGFGPSNDSETTGDVEPEAAAGSRRRDPAVEDLLATLRADAGAAVLDADEHLVRDAVGAQHDRRTWRVVARVVEERLHDFQQHRRAPDRAQPGTDVDPHIEPVGALADDRGQERSDDVELLARGFDAVLFDQTAQQLDLRLERVAQFALGLGRVSAVPGGEGPGRRLDPHEGRLRLVRALLALRLLGPVLQLPRFRRQARVEQPGPLVQERELQLLTDAVEHEEQRQEPHHERAGEPEIVASNRVRCEQVGDREPEEHQAEPRPQPRRAPQAARDRDHPEDHQHRDDEASAR